MTSNFMIKPGLLPIIYHEIDFDYLEIHVIEE
jgi:hypothetical protein